jgi:4-hydroxy-2-oxoheptanedioate aldolase
MRTNSTLEKLRRGEPAFGFELSFGSPLIAEAMSRSGIDFILVDNQHGSYGPETTLNCIIAAEGGTATPIARVARNDYTMIGRLLDEGIMGIVVPMVDTVEQARAAAAACRFPPRGTRSWGWSRARVYGDDYADWIADQLFVAVQIESIQAAEDAEAILAVPGIDGCWVGPGDLSLSFGIHPKDQASHEGHRRALEKVIKACHNTGKIPGIWAGSPAEAMHRAKQGFQFLTSGSDADFLLSGAAAAVTELGLGH